MKYLIIGIWEDGADGCPQVETLPSNVAGDQTDAVEDVVRRIRRKAGRDVDPARVLVIHDRQGPKTLYKWRIGREYGACRFKDPRGDRQLPTEVRQ